jgi:hypothetical protein
MSGSAGKFYQEVATLLPSIIATPGEGKFRAHMAMMHIDRQVEIVATLIEKRRRGRLGLAELETYQVLRENILGTRSHEQWALGVVKAQFATLQARNPDVEVTADDVLAAMPPSYRAVMEMWLAGSKSLPGYRPLRQKLLEMLVLA